MHQWREAIFLHGKLIQQLHHSKTVITTTSDALCYKYSVYWQALNYWGTRDEATSLVQFYLEHLHDSRNTWSNLHVITRVVLYFCSVYKVNRWDYDPVYKHCEQIWTKVQCDPYFALNLLSSSCTSLICTVFWRGVVNDTIRSSAAVVNSW